MATFVVCGEDAETLTGYTLTFDIGDEPDLFSGLHLIPGETREITVALGICKMTLHYPQQPTPVPPTPTIPVFEFPPIVGNETDPDAPYPPVFTPGGPDTDTEDTHE